jgi:hypothetical protein
MKRVKLISTCAGLIVLAAVGCSHSKNEEDTVHPSVNKPAPTPTSQQAAAGDPTAPASAPPSSSAPATPPPPPMVSPGKVDGLLLPLDETGGIISGTLDYEQKFKTPLQPYALGNQSACAVLFGLNTAAVGNDFTTSSSRKLPPTPTPGQRPQPSRTPSRHSTSAITSRCTGPPTTPGPRGSSRSNRATLPAQTGTTPS